MEEKFYIVTVDLGFFTATYEIYAFSAQEAISRASNIFLAVLKENGFNTLYFDSCKCVADEEDIV